MKRLQIGDTVKCRDKEDMLQYHEALQKAGYETEFEFSQGG